MQVRIALAAWKGWEETRDQPSSLSLAGPRISWKSLEAKRSAILCGCDYESNLRVQVEVATYYLLTCN